MPNAPRRLKPAELARELEALPLWALVNNGTAIARSFTFADFAAAFAFMTRVAEAAERADHHPDWSNSWNRVNITLSTHSADGLTPRDIALALEIEKLF
ncbi:4a-hydroxytetrahydrobiopterin dehydratase [Novosphingobium flavum]|uniref:Putative pterin-4-alpha-carbinolamine dehydratase n=1 Tax=Novosphingobium flavum TaxID=1778672 RepID=A0A7X1FNA2_9SPHN|nr:4a-hydroxytetrahydrobiopterin dehydratase [Novosphingobium flavum]MBC2663965.1 4a-hydroxytetrahydrobiopterin dehydratase [Novosphingobium flavum]